MNSGISSTFFQTWHLSLQISIWGHSNWTVRNASTLFVAIFKRPQQIIVQCYMISIHMESSEQYITGYYLYCCCSLQNCNPFKFFLLVFHWARINIIRVTQLLPHYRQILFHVVFSHYVSHFSLYFAEFMKSAAWTACLNWICWICMTIRCCSFTVIPPTGHVY